MSPLADPLLRTLSSEGVLELPIRGTSMGSRYAAGVRVRVSKARVYIPGDVVVFRRSDGLLVIHRLIGFWPSRRGLRVVTKGDASRRHDDPSSAQAILGRVTDDVSARERWNAVCAFARAGLGALTRRRSVHSS